MAIAYVRRVMDLDSDKSVFRIQGFSGAASTNTVTDIDWKLPEQRWLSGGIFIAQGTHWGDKVSIQIIDKDNVLGYGANTILEQLAVDFYCITDSELQVKLECPYVALVPANVYIRVKYTNTSLIDPVEVACNLVTHIPKEV